MFIYSRVGGAWSTVPVYVKASDVDAGDEFGSAVALSGTTLAVGAPLQDSPTDGLDTTNSAVDSGAAYAFVSSAGSWPRTPRILKASNIGNGDNFGRAVAVGAGGSVIVVGAPNEDGDGTGIDPVDTNTKPDSGAAYRFEKNALAVGPLPEWKPPQRFKAANSGAGDLYGTTVAVSSNGQVFAVGAPGEDGTQLDSPNDDGNNVGAVYVYTTLAAGATDVAYLKATHRYDGALFGSSVSISGDGTVLAVGSPHESVDYGGVDGNEDAPPTATNAGAVHILARRANTNWSSQGNTAATRHYVKASNTGAIDFFGSAVSLSDDGNTLVVGAPGEDGNGRNIDANNNPANNQAVDSGAAYLFLRCDDSPTCEAGVFRRGHHTMSVEHALRVMVLKRLCRELPVRYTTQSWNLRPR